MRVLLQRVSEASVRVDGAVVGQCGAGLLILVCAMQGDTEAQADTLAAKVAKCRIFQDARRRHPVGQPPRIFRRRRAGGRAASL